MTLTESEIAAELYGFYRQDGKQVKMASRYVKKWYYNHCERELEGLIELQKHLNEGMNNTVDNFLRARIVTNRKF